MKLLTVDGKPMAHHDVWAIYMGSFSVELLLGDYDNNPEWAASSYVAEYPSIRFDKPLPEGFEDWLRGVLDHFLEVGESLV